MIDKNISKWVDVEESLEGAEAPGGAGTQEMAEADIQEDEIMPLPERRNLSQGYLKS